MDERMRQELEAAAFRALRDHLRARTDVQNIDLMNLAGFCRNCLSRWYQEASETAWRAAGEGGGPGDRPWHALFRGGRTVPDRGRARLASTGFGWLESGWKVACHCRGHQPESAIGGKPPVGNIRMTEALPKAVPTADCAAVR